jgi:hypothetical protein
LLLGEERWILVGKSGEVCHLEDPGVDGRILLKWIFEKWGVVMNWIYLNQDRDRWRAVVKVRNDEPSGSVKCGEFLD